MSQKLLIRAEIMVKGLKGKLTGKAYFPLKIREGLWWAVLGSNQRPPVCKTGTLSV